MKQIPCGIECWLLNMALLGRLASWVVPGGLHGGKVLQKFIRGWGQGGLVR